MSDFPRGWTLSTRPAIGSAATITVPAVAGVVHVLDAILAKFLSSTAAASQIDVTLSSSDGVFSSFELGILGFSGAGVGDELALSGLDLAAGPGASLTIAFTGAVAGAYEALTIQGHDI